MALQINEQVNKTSPFNLVYFMLCYNFSTKYDTQFNQLAQLTFTMH